MSKKHMLRLAFWACLGVSAFGQTPAKIDFGRDVLPILRQNCFGCHGPSQQSSGLRLDRKSRGHQPPGVVPGSSENSFLYHRLSGNEYGMQMPPTGPLRRGTNQHHQDLDRPGRRLAGLAGQRSGPAAFNPKAVAMVEALHTGDLR